MYIRFNIKVLMSGRLRTKKMVTYQQISFIFQNMVVLQLCAYKIFLPLPPSLPRSIAPLSPLSHSLS